MSMQKLVFANMVDVPGLVSNQSNTKLQTRSDHK